MSTMNMMRFCSFRALGSLGGSRYALSLAPNRAFSRVSYRNLSTGPKTSRVAVPSARRFLSSATGPKNEDAVYQGKYLDLRVDGHGNRRQFGPFFLRENCQCSQCMHPDTRQRIVDTFSTPKDIRAKNIAYEAEHAEVEWSDGHRGLYPFDWLIAHQNPTNFTPRKFNDEIEFREFKFHDPANTDYPTVPFDAVMSQDRGLLEWLENIQTWGFCFVKDIPVNPESTQALIERIAFIRHTHYGGFWDFTADMTFKDTAYTTEFLGGHTDNTYFTDPARLQLFHLLSHTDGGGGESLLVDAFEATARLKKQNPSHVTTLSNIRQPAHSSGNDDVCIQPIYQFPVLNTDPETNRLYQVRWNNYDRGARQNWGVESQEEWYDAAREYNSILNSPQMQIWTQLKPGTALIFDNWRMLHGRSEFTGKRRMCGGYVNNDDYLSRYRLLKFGRSKVLQNMGNSSASMDNPNWHI